MHFEQSMYDLNLKFSIQIQKSPKLDLNNTELSVSITLTSSRLILKF